MPAAGDVVVSTVEAEVVLTVEAEEEEMVDVVVEWVVHRGKVTGPAPMRTVAITTLPGEQSATDVTQLGQKAWAMVDHQEVSEVAVEDLIEVVDVVDLVTVVVAEGDSGTEVAVDLVTVDVAEDEDLEDPVDQDQTEEAAETDGTDETSPIKHQLSMDRSYGKSHSTVV